MKRAALITFTLFLLAIVYSSCKDDIYMDWKLQNDRWYATLEDSLKNDTLFHKTSSGLYYKVLHQGYQRKPNASSYVIATYKGKLIDGSTFDSGTNAYLGIVSGLVPGFQEGLKKMNGGGSYILYMPSKLGYDTATINTKIPPHSVLIFDVDLIDSYN
jgi:FKBP-type peptidyl-prolyl cis-trans isomerase FkpA